MNEFVICYSGNVWYSLNIQNNEFKEGLLIVPTDKYITYQSSDLIRFLKAKNTKKVPEIIDLESLDKQFYQSGKDILGYGKWHILKTLRRHEIINEKYRVESVEDFVQKLKLLYEHIISSNQEELQRFNGVELKINKIIHQTELEGIRIDPSLVERRCEELNKEIYRIKNIFQQEYNVFTPENKETQLEYLKSKNYKINYSINKTISLLRHNDELCNLFYELYRTEKDLKSLIFMSSQFGGEELTHPYFIGFGSVTSRIIVKEPSLQNLRKSNRDIIVPKENKKLLYIDYAQFEAGILAHVSSDKKLINLYNQGDIYSDMVSKILKRDDNKDNRKEAKILFYRYLYGDNFSADRKETTKNIEAYFGKFTELIKFKNELIEKSKKEAIVKSIDGNYRRLQEQNENVWILSHYIQSIASYIFKKSIIEVNEKVRNAKLLVPLHDGALYEANIHQFEDIQNTIKKIFESNFQTICPSLNARAEIKDFYIISKSN